MIIGVLKIASIAAPKRLFGRLDDLCSRSFGLFHNRVNFFFTTDIMSNGELGRTVSRFGSVRVISNVGSSPNGELQTGLHIKKGDGSVFELFPKDSLCWETKTVSIEGKRLFQVIYAQCNDCNAWFHRGSIPFLVN